MLDELAAIRAVRAAAGRREGAAGGLPTFQELRLESLLPVEEGNDEWVLDVSLLDECVLGGEPTPFVLDYALLDCCRLCDEDEDFEWFLLDTSELDTLAVLS